jgi:hypothetical protein
VLNYTIMMGTRLALWWESFYYFWL